MKLVMATQNKHKASEISAQLGNDFKVKTLLDINYLDELEENQDTLEGNAFQKARFVEQKFNVNCFADDTGLEIEALNGEPGVYSARYAGEAKSFDDNMNKVLKNLKGEDNRKAQFRTVIALILDGQEYQFEGVCEGLILEQRRGSEGFGYDPIFQPIGSDLSFAEMSLEEKTKIGHRGKAVSKLIRFLKQYLND